MIFKILHWLDQTRQLWSKDIYNTLNISHRARFCWNAALFNGLSMILSLVWISDWLFIREQVGFVFPILGLQNHDIDSTSIFILILLILESRLFLLSTFIYLMSSSYFLTACICISRTGSPVVLLLSIFRVKKKSDLYSILKFSKSQRQFFLKLHCPKNQQNMLQNSVL